ncbi:MAG: hypothetical protein ACP5JP_00470 [bacterium]
MSEKPASNKGTLQILGKKKRNAIAYKHTKDLSLKNAMDIIYPKSIRKDA